MSDINMVVFSGLLGRDPEMKQTASGKTVGNASIACSERYKSGDQYKENTVWIRIVAWERTSEPLVQARKGDKVWVSGKLTSRKYEKDGQEREIWEVVADRIVVMPKPQQQQQRGPAQSARVERPDDEIPF